MRVKVIMHIFFVVTGSGFYIDGSVTISDWPPYAPTLCIYAYRQYAD